MGKPCQQVVIPTVDNTEMECEQFYNSKCIQMIDLPSDIRLYFGWGETETLNEVIEDIARRTMSNTQRIVTLENL